MGRTSGKGARSRRKAPSLHSTSEGIWRNVGRCTKGVSEQRNEAVYLVGESVSLTWIGWKVNSIPALCLLPPPPISDMLCRIKMNAGERRKIALISSGDSFPLSLFCMIINYEAAH